MLGQILKKISENFLVANPQKFVKNAFFLTKYKKNLLENNVEFDNDPLENKKFEIKKSNVYKNIKFQSPKQLKDFFFANKIDKDIITTHALLNIEYNAIFAYSLILNNFYKHKNLNLNYTRKLTNIIFEETTHFHLLDNYLQKKGFKFGDFPVSNNILKDLEKIESFLDHICLISLCHEGKGIDAGPILIQKLKSSGFNELKEIVAKIVADEENHVAFGVDIYKEICSDFMICERQFFKQFSERMGLVPLKPNLVVRNRIKFDFY